MIKPIYEDEKKHVHVLSYGGGTQSTALLLYALEHGINGVKPDFIIMSDTGWEGKRTNDWIEKVNKYIKEKYDREIHIVNHKNIYKDTMNGAKNGTRFASLPFFTKGKDGKKGMTMRQCTSEYKIAPVTKGIRMFLGYEPKKRVKEIVHLWKGISIDEIQRVKPSQLPWQVAEHPLVDELEWDRQKCINYVESLGLGTPPKSSCIGCPFHDNNAWKAIKKETPDEFAEAVAFDEAIRNTRGMDAQLFLHRSRVPLKDVDFGGDQLEIDEFINECEGMCGL